MSKHYSKLIERKIESKILHKGVIGLNKDTVRLINGKTAAREYMTHPGASAALPIIDGNVVLVQQYRYPIKTLTLELPAGKLKKGQSPLACARAELKEETGFTAAKIKKLLTFHPAGAFSDEVLHIFIATGLKPGKSKPDEEEFLNTVIIPLNKAYKMAREGKITDAKTIIALLYYKTFLS